MEDIFGTALVNYACPICGKPAEEAILMNEVLTEKNASEIKDLHGKCVGWSNKACEECVKHKDEAVFLIGIDPEKSDHDHPPYRTGRIIGMAKDSAFINDIDDKFKLTTENGVTYCYCEDAILAQILSQADAIETA